MSSQVPGEWIHSTQRITDIPDAGLNFQISTDRYRCADYQEREKHQVWMKSWQVVGRVDELVKAGDWKEYRLFDQSFVVVRGSDDQLAALSTPVGIEAISSASAREIPLGSPARITCGLSAWTVVL